MNQDLLPGRRPLLGAMGGRPHLEPIGFGGYYGLTEAEIAEWLDSAADAGLAPAEVRVCGGGPSRISVLVPTWASPGSVAGHAAPPAMLCMLPSAHTACSAASPARQHTWMHAWMHCCAPAGA